MNSNLAQVPDQQRIPLETAIAASTPGQSSLVSRLYAAAVATAMEQRKVTDEPGILKHRHVSGQAGSYTWSMVSTATDEASGIFVTLTGTVDMKPNPSVWKEGPFVTFGKKFLQELKPPQLHNTAVKIWR